jgi:HEAT repeat protein
LIAATAATWLLAGCPAPARPGLPPPEVAAADTALRIRIAQAEARRAGGTAELVVLARRGDKPARLLALRGLGRIGALGTVARSETGGGDPDGSAGGAGGSAPRGIDALIAALGDPDPDVVGAAAAAIGVAAALDDDRDLGASDALVAALPRGGRPVVEALGRAGTAAVQPALVAALGDPRLAELAGLALGRHGRRKIALAEPSRQALIAASSAADPAVRYAAVHALGREYQPPDHPASVAALVARLGDPVAEIRAQAIAALGRRKAAGAAGAAGTKLLLDRDWRVAVEAVRALADSDDGKDAIAAAIVRRFDELGRSEPAAAQVVVEGERALAGAAERPVVGSALGALAGRASTAAGLPALTRGWIGCLAIAAIERARPAPDFEAVARCALPDPLRLPRRARPADDPPRCSGPRRRARRAARAVEGRRRLRSRERDRHRDRRARGARAQPRERRGRRRRLDLRRRRRCRPRIARAARRGGDRTDPRRARSRARRGAAPADRQAPAGRRSRRLPRRARRRSGARPRGDRLSRSAR